MEKLKIMCTGEIEVDFHLLKDLQLTESGKSLKATSPEKINKLAKSLREYGIVNNLQVWIDGDDIYCFDAHHRKKALAQLEKEGLEIPLLPATRCLATNKNEAKKLLLLKESSNSWIDIGVIDDYLNDIGFDIKEAQAVIEIPSFEWNDQTEIIDKKYDQHAGSSPWERMSNDTNKSEIIFSFGELTTKIDLQVYQSFIKKCPNDSDGLKKYITGMLNEN